MSDGHGMCTQPNPNDTYVAVTLDDRLPSIASFFNLQLAHRKGPSQECIFPEKNEPACTEMPSLGVMSV